MNYEILLGKTIEEANNFLKIRGWFVTDKEEELHYSNSIKVRTERGVIVEIIGNESKNKKTR